MTDTPDRLNLARLHDTVRRINHIQRYSSLPVIRRENVAEHSWQVAFISMLIGMDLQERGYEVEMTALLERAIAHDLSEAMSGDIIRSYAYSSEQMVAAKRAADDKNTYLLSREFGPEVGDELYVCWRDAKDDTPEGHVVAFADLACVVVYCAEERRMGNTELDHVLKHAWGVMREKWGTQPQKQLWRYYRDLFPTDSWDDPRLHQSQITALLEHST